MTATVYEKARAALARLSEDVLPLALDLLLGLEDPENVAMLRRELEKRSQPNAVECKERDMRPVTELYEAAEEAAGALESEAADDLSRHERGEALLKRIGALDMIAAGGVGTSDLLAVLDLVATLPPERLGLVRWVAGLTASDCALLRWSIADGTCNAMARVLPEDSQRLRAMFASLHDALSGGEGGVKEKPKPTILPAGKPPPFLRVGMVMRERHDWRIGALTSENVWIDAVNAPVQMLMDRETVGAWPLAEPFTVEGES